MSGRIYDLPKGTYQRRCYQTLGRPMLMPGLRALYRVFREQGYPPYVSRMATIGSYSRYMEPEQ